VLARDSVLAVGEGAGPQIDFSARFEAIAFNQQFPDKNRTNPIGRWKQDFQVVGKHAD